MAKYLFDTNIILRFSNPPDAQHQLIRNAVSTLLEQGHECLLSPQSLVEMWVVATRPTDVNGLGWSTDYMGEVVDGLLETFSLVDEKPQLFSTWLDLVTNNDIKGKRTHDARMIAFMRNAKISHILTLNPSDFSGVSDITVVHPQKVLDSKG